MEKELTVMKIGNGKKREDGVTTKIRGYAPRVGKSLAELLKENKEVKMMAMGDAAAVIVKAIAHAQTLLQEEERDIVATEFGFETSTMKGRGGADVPAKVTYVVVKLV